VEAFKVQRAKQRKLSAGRAKRRSLTATIKPATLNRELALLGHLFNHFSSLLEDRNPCRKVKKLDEDNLQSRVLTKDEERLYLMAASQPLRDIAILMLETGARPEEVCRIRRENVFLEQGYVFNPYGKTKAARRKLFLSKSASAVIARRLEQAKGAYLFPGRGKDDTPLVKVNNAHLSAVRRSGVARFRLYDLRHTFATRAIQAGVDLVTVAAMLGHSKINMVLRYAHPSEEHQAAAMRKIQASAAG
jgi:integrase